MILILCQQLKFCYMKNVSYFNLPDKLHIYKLLFLVSFCFNQLLSVRIKVNIKDVIVFSCYGTYSILPFPIYLCQIQQSDR